MSSLRQSVLSAYYKALCGLWTFDNSSLHPNQNEGKATDCDRLWDACCDYFLTTGVQEKYDD
jgi:hypothetical protein